jgi:DNA-binding LytR/AlgR family response regulator
LRFIPVAQVIFFKAKAKYTIVQNTSGEYLIKTPIKELADRLDLGRYWRVTEVPL